MHILKLPKDLIAIRDTREKEGAGWWFQDDPRPGRICLASTQVETISAGDYTVQGYEDMIRVERKAGLSELFGNLGNKANRERFERELDKLRDIPYKYILVESNLSNDILSLGIPQSKFALPASRILQYLTEYQLEFGISTHFVGDAGKRMFKYIVEGVIRKHGTS